MLVGIEILAIQKLACRALLLEVLLSRRLEWAYKIVLAKFQKIGRELIQSRQYSTFPTYAHCASQIVPPYNATR